MVPFRESVTDTLRVWAEPGVNEDELRTRMYRLRSADSGIQLPHPLVSPLTTDGSVSKLRCCLKRNESGSADDGRLVLLGEGRSADQIGPEHVGVNVDGILRCLDPHPLSAARNAAPSSSSTSSITICSCGGKGRSRRKSSSTGNPRTWTRASPARSTWRLPDFRPIHRSVAP